VDQEDLIRQMLCSYIQYPFIVVSFLQHKLSSHTDSAQTCLVQLQ